MPDKVHNVLFLCNGNSARSILAEAILNKEGKGRFHAFSAGSQPKKEVHPHTLTLLRHAGYDTSALRAKSSDEFTAPGAPHLDFVVTVCDNAAGEACPFWPGHPMTAHWDIPDPAVVAGSEAAIATAFETAYRMLKRYIEQFVALPVDDLDRNALVARLKDIGGGEGATEMAAGHVEV
jgi:arsenate reductase